jgi:hypothetical protein
VAQIVRPNHAYVGTPAKRLDVRLCNHRVGELLSTKLPKNRDEFGGYWYRRRRRFGLHVTQCQLRPDPRQGRLDIRRNPAYFGTNT